MQGGDSRCTNRHRRGRCPARADNRSGGCPKVDLTRSEQRHAAARSVPSSDPMRQRTLRLEDGAVLALVPVLVASQEVAQAASFNTSLLFQRSDGSYWRDPSNGCTGSEDRRCVAETECPDSAIISEGWPHASTWIIFDSDVGPNGEMPFHQGLTPGRGCLGRS